MMKGKVTWKKGLSFSGTADTGYTLPLDAAPEVGGNNEGFRPMELMAISLAGCTAMDVISILQKNAKKLQSLKSRFTRTALRGTPRCLQAQGLISM